MHEGKNQKFIYICVHRMGIGFTRQNGCHHDDCGDILVGWDVHRQNHDPGFYHKHMAFKCGERTIGIGTIEITSITNAHRFGPKKQSRLHRRTGTETVKYGRCQNPNIKNLIHTRDNPVQIKREHQPRDIWPHQVIRGFTDIFEFCGHINRHNY